MPELRRTANGRALMTIPRGKPNAGRPFLPISLPFQEMRRIVNRFRRELGERPLLPDGSVDPRDIADFEMRQRRRRSRTRPSAAASRESGQQGRAGGPARSGSGTPVASREPDGTPIRRVRVPRLG